MGDATETLEQLKDGKEYDCLVCDYQMPGMNGLEFLQEWRKTDSKTPFLFLTGQGNESIAAEALRMGADDYYSKDVGLIHYERLGRSVQRLVELAREKQRRFEMEHRIYQLADTAADMIITYDMDGYITYVNKAAQEQSGFSDKELVGKNIIEVVPQEKQGEFIKLAIRDKLKKRKVISFEAEFLHATGRKVIVDVKATLMLEGGLPFEVLLIVRDISNHLLTINELKKSEERFRKFFQLAPEAYYIRKKSGEFIDVNEEAEKLTGYSRAELIGANIHSINIISAEAREEVLNETENMITESGVQETQVELNNKNGYKMRAEIRSVLTELNGEPVILGMIRRAERIN